MQKFIIYIFSLWLATAPGLVLAQASEGRMFGYAIGEQLGDFAPEQLNFSLGFPYVKKTSEEVSPQFTQIQVMVTPVTGTILALQGVAEFQSAAEATEFADRLATALEARFGSNRLYYDIDTCPMENPEVACTSFPPDMDVYWNRVGSFVLRLSNYDLSDPKAGTYSVRLDFGPDYMTSGSDGRYTWLVELFRQEAAQFDETQKQRIVLQEQNGVLQGID